MEEHSRGVLQKRIDRNHKSGARVARARQRAPRAWQINISLRSLKLALALAFSAGAVTVVHTNMKSRLLQSLRSNSSQQDVAVFAPAWPVATSTQPSLPSPESGPAASRPSSLAAFNSQHLDRAAAVAKKTSKGNLARAAADNNAQAGVVHRVGRSFGHVGHFLTKPFHHKAPADVSKKQASR
jgi:hypothetical protein